MKKLLSNVNAPLIGVLAVFGLLYLLGMGAYPSFGDGISFTATALSKWDFATNATNHVAYLNFLRLISLIIPINPYFVFPFLSLIFALLTLFLLHQMLLSLSVDKAIALACVVVFGLSFTFWRHAVITEVYTSHLVFFSAILCQYAKLKKAKNLKHLYAIWILWAVSSFVHIQSILWLPALLWLSLTYFRLSVLKPILLSLLIFAFLFVPPLLNDEQSMASVFFDNGFKTQVLNLKPSAIFIGTVKGIALAIFNFGIASILVIWGLLSKKLWIGENLFWLLIFLPVFGFAARYEVSDNYVFFLPAYMALLVPLAIGLSKLTWRKELVVSLFFLQPLLYFAAWQLVNSTEKGAIINKEKAYKGGVKYYLWPGVRQNPTTFDLGKRVDSGLIPKDFNEEVLLNYTHYLKLKELDSNYLKNNE